MDLKMGKFYDAIHKKDMGKAVIIKVVSVGIAYIEVEVVDISGYIRKSEFMEVRKWNFYEIRSMDDFQSNEADLLEIQWLAVELGYKDLFDKCSSARLKTVK
jgi:hypothetical protein